ncbi:MAG: glycoside hydrolase family 127 protein [Armatimonadota bacterium]|nr:glycoside hydrolase family 127 protein [Armatimonadota bacterium]
MTRERVPRQAEPFPLSQVRLLDSPFREAMERNARYLLSLEPDRLLHRFRLYAGLQPKAPLYGGWEAMGVSGHSLGHHLSACSLQYAASGEEEFRRRVDYIVRELAECQARHGNGYVSAIPEGERIFREISEGNIRAQPFDLNGGWVPWYTMHKLFAGLLDAHTLCANAQALEVARRLGDWAYRTTERLDDEQWQRMLSCEHGGMNESLAHLYALTGDEKYLELARKFYHRAVLDPLARGEDCLPGLHANTQIPKVIGVARLYELTGERRYRRIAEFFWDRVVHHHSYVIGGHSDGEHFGPPDKLSDRLSPNTCETCNTYNMLKLTRYLFAWEPKAEYTDFYERALYNHILASQNPADGMMCYFIPLKPGHYKTYSTPFDSFWCCVGTGMENHTKYGDTIYFQSADGLWVNLFIPSELRWREKGLTLRLETRFPHEDKVRLRFSLQKPVALSLYLRQPYWLTKKVAVRLNGKAIRLSPTPHGYLTLSRRWQDGDTVEVILPQRLHTQAMPDNTSLIAVLHGPLVLAGDLGKIEEPEPRIPVLVTGGKPPEVWLKRLQAQPPVWQTAGVGRPQDVRLIPFHQMHGRRYTVYWRVVSEAQWKQIDEEYRAEQERLRALEARTVDQVQIGDEASERAHGLQGERTSAGEAFGRRWRHAVEGGWFSYEMKVLPDTPVDLLCTYWGSDTGNRVFDILIDGVKVATQRLDNNAPGKFFDVLYPLPAELTQGKSRVTIRWQAHPGAIAGGLFGCRILRREAP